MSEGPAVGVVGADTAPVVTAVEAAGGEATVGAASTVVDGSDYLVAAGESALLAVARTSPTVPVLPVAAGRGVRAVPDGDVADAVESLLAGEFERESHPLGDVTVADRTRATVLLDFMLVSAEPAQISEFVVHVGDERIARFRADGVVVATPGGSSGYARAAGGPVLPPGTAAVAVVPVAPFATDLDHWVVPADDVRLAVERDDTTVSLVADDRVVGPVDPGDPVRMAAAATVEVAVVPSSRSCFDRS